MCFIQIIYKIASLEEYQLIIKSLMAMSTNVKKFV